MGILLTIAYDGTDYCGWQIQKNGVAVQEVVETAVGKALGGDFAMLGASRTDAGVHALGQRAHIITKTPCVVPLNKLPQVINSNLAPDVRILTASAVPDAFHPINDVKSKTYRYRIYNAKHNNPLTRRYAAFMPMPLDAVKMADAAQHFLGEHDFAAYCSTGTNVRSTVREIHAISVRRNGDDIEIDVSGNGFLYNMVRIIAGTLAAVGRGKIDPDAVPAIIAGRDRKKAGKTMPPQGLCLLEIFY